MILVFFPAITQSQLLFIQHKNYISMVVFFCSFEVYFCFTKCIYCATFVSFQVIVPLGYSVERFERNEIECKITYRKKKWQIKHTTFRSHFMRWRHSIFESSMVWSYFRINAILYGAKAIQDEKYKSRDKFAISFSTDLFFSFRRYFSSIWLNWLQNVNNKKEDQRQNIFENERKMLQFLYSVWKRFRNAHDAISFNCSNHCWSF